MNFAVKLHDDVVDEICSWGFSNDDNLLIVSRIKNHLQNIARTELSRRSEAPIRYAVTHVSCNTSCGTIRLTMFVHDYDDPRTRNVIGASYRKC